MGIKAPSSSFKVVSLLCFASNIIKENKEVYFLTEFLSSENNALAFNPVLNGDSNRKASIWRYVRLF